MKASRVKPVDPEEQKKVDKSARTRWLSLVLGESLKKTLSDAFKFVVIAALLAGGWYLYQNFRPAPVSEPVEKPSTGIEAKYSELIDSLEKYHADKGVYPKKIRDAYDIQNKPAAGLIYRGMGRELVLTEPCAADPFSDPCWAGFKKYAIVAEETGKSYTYSSESKVWKSDDPEVNA